MASTATVITQPHVAYGTFTSASTPADEVVTCGFSPKMVILAVDADATAPEIYMSYNDSSMTQGLQVANHDTAQISSPLQSAQINFSGNTFTVDAAIQNASGDNFYLVVG